MKLQLQEYKNKVKGCWCGKNIGGVLGAPFECKRQVNTNTFYVQDLTQGPPPNDDLDLQIVWLAAVEKFGRQVNASILGEYWLSYVIPNWVEYGTGKTNLRAGLVPPMSGMVDNTYRNSCGCFIRSEIWACLAPGHPQIAARYAYEDGIVDHAEEGLYGEVFCAALQSAAFVESDPDTLIDIALSYIPKDCAMARTINKARECYRNHVPALEARKQIHNTAPGTFGIQGIKLKDVIKEGNEGMELGDPGFDAPENVAFMIAGWLYGEGDFEKSLVLANSFGEDTDCTCATLGALLGIILGEDKIPEKWRNPIDDKIVTLCIDDTSKGVWIPKNVEELTQRVIRTMPMFLGQDLADIFAESGLEITTREREDLLCETKDEYLYRNNSHCKNGEFTVDELCALSPYTARYDFPAMRVVVDCGDSIFFSRLEHRKIKVKVYNAFYLNEQQWVKLQLYLPAGVSTVGADCVMLPLNNLSGCCAEAEFTLNTEEFHGAKLEVMLDCALQGRHSYGAAKITLMQKN